MGNQMPPMPDCCQQVLTPVLPKKPSTSLLFAEDAKCLRKTKRKEHLQYNNVLSSQSYISDAMVYSLELSDTENDRTLSIPKQNGAFIEIPQSSTTSADHKFKEAVITGDNKTKTSKRKYYKMMRKKNDKVPLKQELWECEIKLKQEKHEKDLIKRENDILRKKLSALRSKYGIIEPIQVSSEQGYHIDALLSPSNTSLTSESMYDTNITPSAYSTNLTKYPSTDDVYSCHSVGDCNAIKRIIEALKWYSVHGNYHESVYNKMKKNNYGKQIAAHYDHIMTYHLENNDNVEAEYNLICAQINEYVEPCTFGECNGYRRYLRSRNCDNTYIHKAQTEKQHKLQIYVNTMDGIHCCFMHLAKSLQFK